jgi:hypothetical protein
MWSSGDFISGWAKCGRHMEPGTRAAPVLGLAESPGLKISESSAPGFLIIKGTEEVSGVP